MSWFEFDKEAGSINKDKVWKLRFLLGVLSKSKANTSIWSFQETQHHWLEKLEDTLRRKIMYSTDKVIAIGQVGNLSYSARKECSDDGPSRWDI
ncbi:hypothetical protein AAC387_Pa08g2162 [Persea americana]